MTREAPTCGGGAVRDAMSGPDGGESVLGLDSSIVTLERGLFDATDFTSRWPPA